MKSSVVHNAIKMISRHSKTWLSPWHEGHYQFPLQMVSDTYVNASDADVKSGRWACSSSTPLYEASNKINMVQNSMKEVNSLYLCGFAQE